MMMVIMKILDIIIDEKYSPRVQLDENTIERYKELYELNEKIPAPIVQKDKKILIDGYHRIEALRILGKEDVEIEFLDIPESQIFEESIKRNQRHGLPFSHEDRDRQIRFLRFEKDPPVTYVEIGKIVGLSVSRVGEICRNIEFSISGEIKTKDQRRKIDNSQTEEIMDRLEKGESVSEVAKDYPISESRVSQLKKKPKKRGASTCRRRRRSSILPKKMMIYNLKRRFNTLNPNRDEADFVDWDILDSTLEYSEVVDQFADNYSEYEWYYPREKPDPFMGESPYSEATFIDITLKVNWIEEGKYAEVKGRIPKKALDYIRERLYPKFDVKWPLIESDDLLKDEEEFYDIWKAFEEENGDVA